MTNADKLEEELIKLSIKYDAKITYIAWIPEDDGNETLSIASNTCFVCAKENLDEHIRITNLQHISKEKVH